MEHCPNCQDLFYSLAAALEHMSDKQESFAVGMAAPEAATRGMKVGMRLQNFIYRTFFKRLQEMTLSDMGRKEVLENLYRVSQEELDEYANKLMEEMLDI